MRNRHKILPLIFLIVLLLPSCTSLLISEKRVVEPHIVQLTPQVERDAVRAADYSDIYSAIEDMITGRQLTGKIQVFEYSSNTPPLYSDTDEYSADRSEDFISTLSADTLDICRRIELEYPLASYALEEYSFDITQIISYYEINLTFSYKKSYQQMQSVISVSTTRYLTSELLEILSSLETEAAIITSLPDVDSSFIQKLIEDNYYSNPSTVIMMPIVKITTHPKGVSSQKLFDIQLDYDRSIEVLKANAELLSASVAEIARLASGGSDIEILLSLVNRLSEIASYDKPGASLPQYSLQNYTSTAYGALLSQFANAEGYAMAYKALCDQLGIECVVVRGERGGYRYAWCIVTIGSDSYHIDPAMCDEYSEENGLADFFLKSSATMLDMGYSWQLLRYPSCPNDWVFPSDPEPSPIIDAIAPDSAGDNNSDDSLGENDGF